MPDKPRDVSQYLEIGCGRCKFGGTPECKVRPWAKELALLRSVLQQTSLLECIKWSSPCYTLKGRNVLTLSALKDSVVVSFFRGAELSDPKKLLERPGENSRFARYLRFTTLQQIHAREKTLLAYVREAIQLEQSGETPQRDKPAALDCPEELRQAFELDPQFQQAFQALTPGRQRGYLIYFLGAKQSTTRATRIAKLKPKIFEGKGWNER